MTTPLPTPHSRGFRRFVRPTGTALATAVLTLLLLVLPSATSQDQPEQLDAQAVLDAVIENLRGESQRATIVMRVERSDEVTEYELQIVSDGEDRALTQVIAPPRDAGQAFLNVDNNIFIYNPRLKRTLRLPPSGRSNSFLGSDISYNDLTGDDYRTDYTATITDQTDDTITLELTPEPQAPTPYGKLVFIVDARTMAPRELKFFDQRGNEVKRLLFSEYVEVDGRFIPIRFEVDDLLEPDSRTVLEWKEFEFGVTVPESCFTQEALERGCS